MSNILSTAGTIEEQLRLHGSYASNTRGTSMEPLFRTHRDMVIILPVTEPLKKYDVPLYRLDDGSYVLHRIIGFYEDGYLIRGDNTFLTERVPHSKIVGVLSEFNRKGKSGSCRDRGYRIYSRVWCFIYPVRYVLYKIRRMLSTVYHALIKRDAKKTKK